MRKALLGISCCVGFIAPFVFAIVPAQAAGPDKLNPGDKREYSTWQAGKSTKFCVQNLDSNRSGKVNINVWFLVNHQEDVNVSSGSTKCIDRGWGGITIVVTNTGQTLVKVWTE